MTMGMSPGTVCQCLGGVVTWRAEMDGIIPIYERHPPIGHTPIGRIRDVPISYQSDWLGPLFKFGYKWTLVQKLLGLEWCNLGKS